MRLACLLVYRLLQGVLTALTAFLLVPVCLQIASRFTSLVPRYVWTEEVARFTFVWIIMIGSMLAVRDGTHFDLDVFPKPKSARGRALSQAIKHVAMAAVALTFVWFGIEFLQLGAEQESDLTGLNMAWVHGAWPVAGAVYLLFLVEKLADDWRLWRGHRS